MRIRTWIWSVVVFALMAAAAWAAGVDGKWKAEYQSPDGETRQVTLTLKASGESLTGTAAFSTGDVPIQEGKVSGNGISFSVIRNFGGDDIKFVYKGAVAGDEIKFTVTVAAMDRSFQMTAKRVN